LQKKLTNISKNIFFIIYIAHILI